jgi:predicted phosphoribosyltransferase
MLFDDRVDAAKQLAKRLKEWLDNNMAIQGEQLKYNNTVIILAIPRWEVVVGDVIASMLGVKLDIIVSRKIGAPNNPELAIGAVMADGIYSLNGDIVNMLNVPLSYITEQANIQKKEIERRLQSFRGQSKGKKIAITIMTITTLKERQ